jgi:hypothetical protein
MYNGAPRQTRTSALMFASNLSDAGTLGAFERVEVAQALFRVVSRFRFWLVVDRPIKLDQHPFLFSFLCFLSYCKCIYMLHNYIMFDENIIVF